MQELERDVLLHIHPERPCNLGPDFREIGLTAAMNLFLVGEPVYVDWDYLRRVEKDKWSEFNINHLQRGKWYFKKSSETH